MLTWEYWVGSDPPQMWKTEQGLALAGGGGGGQVPGLLSAWTVPCVSVCACN